MLTDTQGRVAVYYTTTRPFIQDVCSDLGHDPAIKAPPSAGGGRAFGPGGGGSCPALQGKNMALRAMFFPFWMGH
jgi:hypothetical protein